jgi:outer membrane lipoprotein-sorting protein
MPLRVYNAGQNDILGGYLMKFIVTFKIFLRILMLLTAGYGIFSSDVFSSENPTGYEILKKMDTHKDFTSIEYSAIMEIHIKNKIRTKSLKVLSLSGDETRAIVEFTNTEDEGTKYLMIAKNLWIYFPEEEDVVKISGHMLKEGMMGSDVSYEDALESDALSDKYTVTLSGEENINSQDCYVLTLDAKVKKVPYYKRKMWVDKNTFVALKEEMYAKSGKMLKVSNVLEMENINGRNIATKVEMVNVLRKDSRTVFTMQNIIFDKPLDEKIFTLRYLRK